MASASVNKVLLLGNLTREVDLRYTQAGKPVAELSLALNRRNGEHEEVCFVDVAVWGKTAENCKQYLGKGSCVHVEGYLKQERWEDRNTGKSRSKLRVVAESVQFVSTPRPVDTRAEGPNAGNSGPISPKDGPPTSGRRFYGDPGGAIPAVEPPDQPPVDDDIPF